MQCAFFLLISYCTKIKSASFYMTQSLLRVCRLQLFSSDHGLNLDRVNPWLWPGLPGGRLNWLHSAEGWKFIPWQREATSCLSGCFELLAASSEGTPIGPLVLSSLSGCQLIGSVKRGWGKWHHWQENKHASAILCLQAYTRLLYVAEYKYCPGNVYSWGTRKVLNSNVNELQNRLGCHWLKIQISLGYESRIQGNFGNFDISEIHINGVSGMGHFTICLLQCTVETQLGLRNWRLLSCKITFSDWMNINETAAPILENE